jgi:hypothetical protein
MVTVKSAFPSGNHYNSNRNTWKILSSLITEVYEVHGSALRFGLDLDPYKKNVDLEH